jgi:tryptophan synthase beta chain
MSLIGQEVSTDEWIDIPGEVIDVYRLWRPSPLFRATRLEAALDTPAHIYYKYEGVSPAGSHKPNTAVPQAYFNKEAGIRASRPRRAGQGSAWRSCARCSASSATYMVKASCRPEAVPADLRGDSGRRRGLAERQDEQQDGDPRGAPRLDRFARHRDQRGRRGRRDADDTNYALGSVLGHVLLHQSVIGLEAQQQMEMAGERPDVVVGCVGGGSNYAGISYPFMAGKLRGETPDMRFLATEPAACPTLTKGRFAYDYGDTAQISPIVPMYTLGHDFVPAPVHAGGLRYHGDSPSLSLLVKHGTWRPWRTRRTIEAGLLFANRILPAPEANTPEGHDDEAIAAREAGRSDPLQPLRHGHWTCRPTTTTSPGAS